MNSPFDDEKNDRMNEAAKRARKRGYIGKCQCGGDVYGVREFGRLWSYCADCTPVVKANHTSTTSRHR